MKITIEAIAIILGPLIGVFITLMYSKWSENRRAKIELFRTLVSTKDRLPIPEEFVRALNTIDYIFSKNKNVINAWNELYEELHMHPVRPGIVDKKKLDLVEQMAKTLGYKNIKLTTISKYYSPQQFHDQLKFQETLNNEWIRVLKNTENMGTPRKENEKNKEQKN